MALQISRDAEGYLTNPDDWDETIAAQLAGEEGIELNEEYWTVIQFMRGYYNEHKIAADVRHLISYLAAEKNCDSKATKQHIFDLFPYGYVKQACKIAGMKRPRAWSTG